MKNLYFWVVIAIIEIIILILFRVMQPLCEPCPPQQDCPACISNAQIALIIVGILILPSAVFIKRFLPTSSKK